MQLKEIFDFLLKNDQLKRALSARHIECNYAFKRGVERVTFDDYEIQIDHHSGERDKLDVMIRQHGHLKYFQSVHDYRELVKFLENHHIIPKLATANK